MSTRSSRRIANRSVGAALGIGLVATAVFGAVSPSLADTNDPIRTWTGAKGSAVGTGLATQSCDFTGDGKPDLLTSDWLWERPGFGDIGAVYVVPNGTASGQLDDPTTGITRIEGSQSFDVSVGFRLNCAGDVNGDGFDDVLIDEGDSSRVWVVFGSATPENISLEFLGTRGFAIDRAENVDAGYDVSSAGVGDLDGDGYDDVAIVSARSNDAGGQVTVVKGRPGIATVHSERDEEVLMRIDAEPGQGLNRLQAAGDIDGDGIGDLIVAAPDAITAASGVRSTGSAWVVSGASRGTVALAGEFDGFAIEGPADRKNRFGMSVVSAGDVNGDGFADVVIGAPGSGVEGGVAVVLGSDSHDTVYTDPDATNGHALWSGDAGAETSRGWWIRDSESGRSNLIGFNIGADEAVGDAIGTIVVGMFVQSAAVALPTTLLGEDPVIDISTVDAAQKAVYSQPGTFLGRTISVLQNFDEASCVTIALGGNGADTEGAVNLYAVPWAESAPCNAPAAGEPGDPGDPSDPTDPTDPTDPGPVDPAPEDPAASSDAEGSGSATPPGQSGEAGGATDAEGTGSGSGSGSSDPLATTGAQQGVWVAAGLLLLVLGAGCVVLVRKQTR